MISLDPTHGICNPGCGSSHGHHAGCAASRCFAAAVLAVQHLALRQACIHGRFPKHHVPCVLEGQRQLVVQLCVVVAVDLVQQPLVERLYRSGTVWSISLSFAEMPQRCTTGFAAARLSKVSTLRGGHRPLHTLSLLHQGHRKRGQRLLSGGGRAPWGARGCGHETR